jgi:hypothetical protein
MAAGGCFGGSNSSVSPQPPPEEDLADVVTFGTITGFGSVYANGQVFDCDAATVTMNDRPGQVSDLRVGHVVSIVATVRSRHQVAMARQISCLDEAEGPIAALDPVTNSFVVLGRKVYFDEMTVFEGVGYDELANGNVVRVIGLERHQDRIQATHIERLAHAWAAGIRMEVKGEIQDLDPGLMRFRIGSQWCDYSNAMLELGGKDLGAVLYVHVSGASHTPGGDLALDQVRARDRDRDRDHLCRNACAYVIDGFITDYVSPFEFVVDGTTITVTDTTTYVNGTVDSLGIDVRVSVSGDVIDNGVFVADKVVFKLPSNIQIEASVEAVNVERTSVALLGIDVLVNDSTMFRDEGEVPVYEFGLDDLAIGDRVRIRAYLNGDTVVAARLDRVDAEAVVILKAPVEAVERPGLTLLGVPVTAHAGTVFQSADKTTIDAVEFFDLVEVGTLVKAIGTDNGATLMADKVLIRNCEHSCL